MEKHNSNSFANTMRTRSIHELIGTIIFESQDNVPKANKVVVKKRTSKSKRIQVNVNAQNRITSKTRVKESAIAPQLQTTSAPPLSSSSANENSIPFVYHYGGYFTCAPNRIYISGNVLEISLAIDFVCFFDLLDVLREKCGFDICKGDKFYYLRAEHEIGDCKGLVEILDDGTVKDMINNYKEYKKTQFHIYALSSDNVLSNSSYEEQNYFENNHSPAMDEGASTQELENQVYVTTSAESSKAKRKARGPTRCLKIIGLDKDEKLNVEFDEDCNPIGCHVTYFTSYLGLTVRTKACCPLQVKSWKYITGDAKDHMWQIILEKFNFEYPEEMKGSIFSHMGALYRDYRYKLKREYFDKKQNYQERFRKKRALIDTDDWKYLVDLWTEATFQERSNKSKTSRAKRSMPTYSGTKSYARLREEMRKKNGYEPSRVDVFIESRKRKKGKDVDTFTQDVIEQFESLKKQREEGRNTMDDEGIFVRVLGPEKNGYIRAYGHGMSITSFFGSTPSKVELLRKLESTMKESNERVDEVKAEAKELVEKAQKEANEKNEQMKKDMDAKMQEMRKEFEEKLKQMMDTQKNGVPN